MTTVARRVVAVLAATATVLALAAPARADGGTTPQTITFVDPGDSTVGQGPVALSATSDSGLPVTFTIDASTGTDPDIGDPVCGLGTDGASVVIAHAGSCVIDADQEGDDTYAPAATVQQIIDIAPSDQSIDFTVTSATGAVGGYQQLTGTATSGLDVTYTITGDSVSAKGDPACDVVGTLVYFDHVGPCTIEADQDGDNDYTKAPTVEQHIDVGQGAQSITFDPLPAGVVGDQHAVSPTSTANLPVSLTIDSSADVSSIDGEPVCSTDGTTVFYTHAGTCVVDANQDGTDGTGNDDYAAAAPQQQSVVIGKAAQSISFDNVPASAAIGTTAARPTAASNQVDDGTTVTLPPQNACSLSGNTVRFNHAGSCVIHAENPGNDDYLDSGDQTQTITVSKANTAATVSLHQAPTATEPTITVRVTALAPAVVPSVNEGTVAITVDGTPAGDVAVTNGVATLDQAMAPTTNHVVTATYTAAANGDFENSDSVDAHRNPPSIAVHLSSAAPKTKFGWYRTPVTASFTCTRGTAAYGSCPSRSTLAKSGKRQTVHGAITADDGGAASTSASVNIDLTKPRVIVAGVTDGNTYIGRAPSARCLSTDTLSGVQSCTLVRTAHASGVTTYRATATDKAGNTATVTGSYRVQRFYLREAIYDASNNCYIVQTGTEYTLVALAYHRPSYLRPVRLHHTPRASGGKLVRTGTQAKIPRWTRTVSFGPSLHKHTFWVIGVKAAGVLHRITIRVG